MEAFPYGHLSPGKTWGGRSRTACGDLCLGRFWQSHHDRRKFYRSSDGGMVSGEWMGRRNRCRRPHVHSPVAGFLFLRVSKILGWKEGIYDDYREGNACRYSSDEVGSEMVSLRVLHSRLTPHPLHFFWVDCW